MITNERFARQFRAAIERVEHEYGNGARRVGQDLYEALLCRAVLSIAASMDDSTPAAVQAFVQDGIVWAAAYAEARYA